MPKISIIVPVFNVENYLQKCLDSIINQTNHDLEIICINDGSTDNSLEILKRYSQQDSRIQVFNQKHSGVSTARNKGIQVATGEYIGFVDSDDWIDSDFYEKLYSTARKYNADIAAASIIREKKNKSENYYIYKDVFISDNYDEKIKICDIPNYCYIWNKIYKTSELKKSNLKFEAGLYYEDIIFTPKILYELKKLVTVPDTYIHYVMREKSIVHEKRYDSDYQKAMEIAEKFLYNKNIDVEELKPKTKRLKLFGITIARKTTRKENPYAITRFK